MDRLIYTCSDCGNEQQDLASAAKIQFCFKCGGRDFASRLPEAETLQLKCEALMLVVSELTSRLSIGPEELLKLVRAAEDQVRSRSEQPLAESKAEPPAPPGSGLH